MKNSGFMTEEYQKRLIITTEEDVPFQAINSEIHECDFNDLIEGRWYYLISESWFERWSFYYEEGNHTLDKSHIKSTKMLQPLDKGPRKKKKKVFAEGRRNSSSHILIGGQMNSSLIEQPNSITFDDV